MFLHTAHTAHLYSCCHRGHVQNNDVLTVIWPSIALLSEYILGLFKACKVPKTLSYFNKMQEENKEPD